MRLLKILSGVILFLLLTVITQVGGMILILSLPTFKFINKRTSFFWSRIALKTFTFIVFYITFTLLIIPLIARPFGRVPLPILENRYLKPATIVTCLLNRHYVKPQLREIAYLVAEDLNSKYPGTKVNYLDGNFPFIDKFPLPPHLSHNDGKKLDLSFQYNNSKTGDITNEVPSFIGYGICEEPGSDEEDMPDYCEKKGYWQYNFLRNHIPQRNKENFTFDEERTKTLINALAAKKETGKIFIEPHLKARLKLTNGKIRFHGCQAVRHDDHIHVQLK